jgi:hypothetical protein
MHVDYPTNGAVVLSTGFTVTGWAIDAAATTTTGVDWIDVWAMPVNGAPAVYVNGANYGAPRPDVGAAFARSAYTSSGFSLSVALAPGVYDLAVFARSTISGTFNNVQMVRVTVEAPPSNPRMWVDTPQQNDNLSQNVYVSGWALDLNAGNNPGVDAVHVWAYPTNGAPPIMVGAALVGGMRPDVGAAFGHAKFTNSGFAVGGTLPRGSYTLVVFAHSSVANAFNNVFTININVL